ncbi:MAG: DUF502 domain-containing protein [Syntrophomonadaceae bacterium]|nr:DUF502 domain-containing protein [Syntrophomonadaceae bacterium]
MKKLFSYFLQGILTFLPVALTLYIVVAIFKITDGIIGKYFIRLGINIPGLGILTTLILITIVGILSNWFLSRRVFDYIDRIFGRTPLIKLVYNIIKDTVNALLGNKNYLGKVVMISLPGDEKVKILGFLTAEEVESFGLKDYVAVYVMQSMQWAGFTLLVPRERVELLDVKAEQALQFIVSAGITGKDKNIGHS